MQVKIKMIDRLERSHEFEAHSGQSFKQFLLTHYIPNSAILLKVNGQITDDQTYIIKEKDEIQLTMIRAYQLPEYCQMLDLWAQDKKKNHSDSIYTYKMLWFNESGVCDLKQAPIPKDHYCEWLENKFVEAIILANLIQPQDHICLPLSGGRDSLALLYLLERTKHKLPPFSFRAATVAPIAASSGDLAIAAQAIKNLGVQDYTILGFDYVKETLNLKNDFNVVMEQALSSEGRGVTISLWHGIMKACIERFSRESNLSKIAYGYQFEDLMASLLRSNLLGIPFGESMQKKRFGTFDLVFPLWSITKKELTIYLNLIAPQQQSQQSNPTQYDRGDHNRDIHYFLADTLSTLYPGIGFSLFAGHQEFNQKYVKPEVLLTCLNCKGVFALIDAACPDHLCFTCDYFSQIDALERMATFT